MLDQIDELARLNTLIADLLDRIAIREVGGEKLGASLSGPVASGFSIRLREKLRLISSRQKRFVSAPDALEEGAGLSTLQDALKRLRAELGAIHISGDPIALTTEIAATVGQLLPGVLAARVALSEEERFAPGRGACQP